MKKSNNTGVAEWDNCKHTDCEGKRYYGPLYGCPVCANLKGKNYLATNKITIIKYIDAESAKEAAKIAKDGGILNGDYSFHGDWKVKPIK